MPFLELTKTYHAPTEDNRDNWGFEPVTVSLQHLVGFMPMGERTRVMLTDKNEILVSEPYSKIKDILRELD